MVHDGSKHWVQSQNSTAYMYIAGQDLTAGGCPELELHDAQGGSWLQTPHRAIIIMSHMPVVAHIHATKPAEF